MKKKHMIILLILTFLCVTAEGIHAYYKNNVDTHSSRTSHPSSTFMGNQKEDDSKITNIALFGIDTGREKNEATHSDAIMILSIDKVHKKLKLSSFIRDTYVAIEGHGNHKLNAAYAIGGPELAIKTLNQNFDMDIKDYITVDFVGLSSIVDAMGGVEVTVKKKEINEINKYIKETAGIKGVSPVYIEKEGLQKLNGVQATAYARIRKVGEGDFDRAERQKNVLGALFEHIKNQEITRYPAIVANTLPYVKTSLSGADIITNGTSIMKAGLSNLDWYRFPLYGYCQGEIINKGWYLTTDLKVTTEHLHQFVYNDVKVPPLKDSF